MEEKVIRSAAVIAAIMVAAIILLTFVFVV